GAAAWTARHDESLELLERAEASFRHNDDVRGVARTCVHQARMHAERRHIAVSEGIMGRVSDLLESVPEAPEHGLLATYYAQRLSARGAHAEAIAQAERARDIGRRVGDRNVEAMAVLWLGPSDMFGGRGAGGIAPPHPTTPAALSGELDPYFAGDHYCPGINACRDRADWQRAAEWTERADRWSARESIGFFPGVCRVHRAEIMRFRGALRDAERDVMRGCELLMDVSPTNAIFGYRELAE